jgi:Trk-type K+ transport system membrane component
MTAAGPSPLRYLAGSFLILIGVGAALLLLPAATTPEAPIGVVDAVFTATSAACVTGLIVRDTGGDFTLFGQAVILVLIQLGGTTLANPLSITMAGIFVVIVALLVLLFLEGPHATVDNRHGVFIAYLFETVSALGTVGLSWGITDALSPASRLLVAVLMFLGRLGPLTVAASFARENPPDDWQCPEEDVMVG